MPTAVFRLARGLVHLLTRSSPSLAPRRSLEESLALFGRLAQYISRLDQLALAGAGVAVGAVGLEPEGIVLQAGRFLCQLSDALRELLVGRREYQQAVGNPAVTADSLARLDGYLSSARSLGESVARIAASVNSVKLHVLLSSASLFALHPSRQGVF